jgi:hypothetical protein
MRMDGVAVRLLSPGAGTQGAAALWESGVGLLRATMAKPLLPVLAETPRGNAGSKDPVNRSEPKGRIRSPHRSTGEANNLEVHFTHGTHCRR